MVVYWPLKPIEQPHDPLAEPSLLSYTVGMVATLDARAPVIFTCDALLSAHGGIHLNTITFVEEDAWFGIIRILWTLSTLRLHEQLESDGSFYHSEANDRDNENTLITLLFHDPHPFDQSRYSLMLPRIYIVLIE